MRIAYSMSVEVQPHLLCFFLYAQIRRVGMSIYKARQTPASAFLAAYS